MRSPMTRCLQPLCFLAALLLPSLCPLALNAQAIDRLVIYTKSGEKIALRTDFIDSMKVASAPAELSFLPSIQPHSDGTTGKMRLAIDQAGSDITKIKAIFPERYLVERLSDEQCQALFTSEKATALHTELYQLQPAGQYDLTDMQQGYRYMALFLPYDQYDCPGEVVRLPFDVPKGPLYGHPDMQVSLGEVTYDRIEVTLTPNADVKGYYFLCDLTDNPDREQSFKMLNVPDLKHYVVRFGGSFPTQAPHEGAKTFKIPALKPNQEYTLYLVLIDAHGQLSEVIDTHKVTTKKKGTSATAHVAIAISDITATSATVTTTPDANTSRFRETIYKQGGMTDEQITRYLTETPESPELAYHTATYQWTWPDLQKGTTYVAVAIAQNADGQWGPLEKKTFTTAP